MKILVTGGTGFIGTHFMRSLVVSGSRLSILDLHPPDEAVPPGVSFIRGDIRDPGTVARAIEGCDAVLHLAAAHHDFGLDRDTYFSVNERGTQVLCDAMTAAGVQRICFFSSAAVYGGDGRHDEFEAPAPASPYGQSKLAAERVLDRWCQEDERRSCLVIRPTVVFGPGNFANMYKLIRQIDSGFFLPVGQGTNRKSMAFVDNVVGATMYAWADHAAGWAVYNYADKPDLTSRGIVESIYEALGKRPPRLHVPLRLALLLAWPFDLIGRGLRRPLRVSRQGVHKLAGVTSVFQADRIVEAGYTAAVPLREGIQRMVDWYRSGRVGAAPARLPPAQVELAS